MREATAPRPPSFASLVQQFFTEYLLTQRALSPRTIVSYRDALMLFLAFFTLARREGQRPLAELVLRFWSCERERQRVVARDT